VTDLHLRILRMIANQRQRRLEDHNATDRAGGMSSADRRRSLEQAAGHTKANVAAAEARRRSRRPRRTR
jgi:hypothetical protein